MEFTRHIGRYTWYASLGVTRRSRPTEAVVSQAKARHHRAFKALMDEVDRTPAKLIDRFLTRFMSVIWDLPGGEAQWSYLQGTLTRAAEMIRSLKSHGVIHPHRLEGAAIVIGCALDETRGWSHLRVEVDDPKYATTQAWSFWEGSFLPWLIKWQICGELPDYRLDRRSNEANLSSRIQEIKTLLLPSIERQLGEALTNQLWAYAMGVDGVTPLGRLIRLEVTEGPGDWLLSQLLLLVETGELELNQNQGQVFTQEKRTYFVHPKCLRQLVEVEGNGDAERFYGLLRAHQLASEAAQVQVLSRGGRAVKLWCFSVENDDLRQQAERLQILGDLASTSPWLQSRLPLFEGKVEVVSD